MKIGKKEIKDKLNIFLIRHSSFFDENYYRHNTGIPDSVDAARHYYEGGWRNSDPSLSFRQKKYLDANRDVNEADQCPLSHYLVYGKRDGRLLSRDQAGTDVRYQARSFRRRIKRSIFEVLHHQIIQNNKQARILVIAHIYYEDAAAEMMEYIRNRRPYHADVVVTTTADRDVEQIRSRVSAYCENAEIRIFENIGYDIYPFISVLRETDLSQYDVIIKIHSKRLFPSDGIYTENCEFHRGRDWFTYLMESTLGAGRVHQNINQLMKRDGYWLTAAQQLLRHDLPGCEGLTRFRLKQAGLELRKGYRYAAGAGFCMKADKMASILSVEADQELFREPIRGSYGLTQAMERYITGIVPEDKQYAVPVCKRRWRKSNQLRTAQEEKRRKQIKDRADELAQEEAELQKEKLTVAFAVTEAGNDAVAGDYFTALELAEALQKRGCRVKFLSRKDPSRPWEYAGRDTDVLISMLQDYPTEEICGAREDLIKIGWARNWFDKWMIYPGTLKYDILLASSETSRREMEQVLEREVILFPIATNPNRFAGMSQNTACTEEERERFTCDYCFTGNRFNVEREIEKELDPGSVPFRFKIFGQGWEESKELGAYSNGHVQYEDIPKVYSCTKIVLDDATPSTKITGAMNSRVYDALMAGCLVLTNNERGSRETFEGKLPAFHDAESLREELLRYLQDEELRQRKVRELQDFVANNHTYEIRAERLLQIIQEKKAAQQKYLQKAERMCAGK